jgi:hypothetical protein
VCLQLARSTQGIHRLVLVSACRAPTKAERTTRRDADDGSPRRSSGTASAFLERWIAQPLFATLPRERSGIDERRARTPSKG